MYFFQWRCHTYAFRYVYTQNNEVTGSIINEFLHSPFIWFSSSFMVSRLSSCCWTSRNCSKSKSSGENTISISWLGFMRSSSFGISSNIWKFNQNLSPCFRNHLHWKVAEKENCLPFAKLSSNISTCSVLAFDKCVGDSIGDWLPSHIISWGSSRNSMFLFVVGVLPFVLEFVNELDVFWFWC